MPRKDRPRLVASSSSATKLFVDDLREVNSLSLDEGKSRSDIIRELVHEALRLRRLQAIGRDQGEDYIRRIHREVIDEGLDPVMKAVAGIRSVIEVSSVDGRSESQGIEDTKTIELLSRALAQLLQKTIVTENVVKILMTVGMQKDGISAEEIRKQLLSQDEDGVRQAREVMKKFLGDRLAVDLTESE
jgi:Ribbon-helix-helix protein, copG family